MTDHFSRPSTVAEGNVRKWAQAKHTQERMAKQNARENVGPFIAISRETGAGGSEIARAVAEKLGWDVLDKEIVDYLATEYETPRSLVELMDEKSVSWIEDLFTSWIEGKRFTSNAYVHRLSQLLLLAGHHGNVVIVGRGAQFVLPRERGLSVRIVAPLPFRVEQLVLQRGLSATEAQKFIEDSDRQRTSFVKDHFHGSTADAHNFDLAINVAKLDRTDATNLIVDATRSWIAKSGVVMPGQ